MFENLIKNKDSDIAIVASPDHPVLVTPPDGLVAKNGKIAAYYKLLSTEKKSPKNLLSRLALCRYALPTHTQHILIANENNDSSVIDKVYSSFDRVIELNDLNQSLLLLNESPNNLSVERATVGRDKHYVKYNLLYELSIQQLRDDEPEERRVLDVNTDNYEKAIYSNWFGRFDEKPIKGKSYESKYFSKTSNGYFSTPDFVNSKRRFDLLRRLCISSLQIDSIYEDGVLSKVTHESKLILSQNLPGYTHDELKGLRGAAFAGLGLSHAKSYDSADRYSEYINYRFERGLHEYSKKKNRYNKRNNNR
ncbi:hypothetical protein [Shewanella scandinavica]|uniref:Uncharacterized protein n=1 Tax=Shewanella scandinavica TaxID=3063538 RepID=A0ABU3G5U6_9GAMM|nr:hypothetical protein [Shewanella sp. SP2S1-2]MDT3282996.1 hypothetical protein [Shewanella sp. SP2S1-2]